MKIVCKVLILMSFTLKRLSITSCNMHMTICNWRLDNKVFWWISRKSIFLCQSSGADLEGGGVCGLDTPWNFQNIHVHLGEQHLNIFDIIRCIFVCTFQNFLSLVARSLLYLNRMKVHLCFDVNSKLAVGILFFIISMQNNNK